MEFVGALIVTLVAAPVLRRVALRRGFVDRPGPLKTHRAPVPYLGGVAVFLGLVVGPATSNRPWVLVPYALALALGVTDDIRPTSPSTRLAGQLVIAVAAGLVVPGPVGGRIGTAVLVVVLMNAVNLLDGQDALASGACLLSAVAFAVLGGDAQPVGLALGGALAAFLVFNAPPARMYLGDGGAYLIGAVLATLPSLTAGATSVWPVWIATPLLVALPLADTGIAVIRRVRERRPLLLGDRSHVYDALVDRGWPTETSTAACVLFQGVLGAIGVVAAGLDAAVALAVTAVTVTATVALAAAAGFLGRARFGPGRGRG
jgi:UDP-GlcNAc:undecaprenyl-phosphate GlcNAc-1-phosphate transferase